MGQLRMDTCSIKVVLGALAVFILCADCYQVVEFERSPTTERPPYNEKAKRTRYIVHNCTWGSIGTISTMTGRAGLPFTNVISISDGRVGNSTGTPYFYVTDLDATSLDVKQNNSVSFTLSEMQTGYCEGAKLDAEDPRCTRVTLTGTFVKLTDADEIKFALDALFSRHPAMKGWSVAHEFYPAKLNIDMVWMIDFFGGASIIPLDKYYAANP